MLRDPIKKEFQIKTIQTNYLSSPEFEEVNKKKQNHENEDFPQNFSHAVKNR